MAVQPIIGKKLVKYDTKSPNFKEPPKPEKVVDCNVLEDDDVYGEYIEILYSLSPGDDIGGGIEFEFDGIELPEITESGDPNFGGVVLPDDSGGFNWEVSTFNRNTLRLTPAPEVEASITAAGITEEEFNIVDMDKNGRISIEEWEEPHE